MSSLCFKRHCTKPTTEYSNERFHVWSVFAAPRPGPGHRGDQKVNAAYQTPGKSALKWLFMFALHVTKCRREGDGLRAGTTPRPAPDTKMWSLLVVFYRSPRYEALRFRSWGYIPTSNWEIYFIGYLCYAETRYEWAPVSATRHCDTFSAWITVDSLCTSTAITTCKWKHLCEDMCSPLLRRASLPQINVRVKRPLSYRSTTSAVSTS